MICWFETTRSSCVDQVGDKGRCISLIGPVARCQRLGEHGRDSCHGLALNLVLEGRCEEKHKLEVRKFCLFHILCQGDRANATAAVYAAIRSCIHKSEHTHSIDMIGTCIASVQF